MEKDSLLLGRIKEIQKYKLIISLPHNKTGVCLISRVSQSYNNLLEQLVDDNDVENNDVPELNKLFTKGQIVQVKLIQAINSSKFDVTMLPSAVNCSVNCKRIKTGMKMQMAIKSAEDKGYILETGIDGINGFLPFANCSSDEYPVGKLIEVCPINLDKTHSKSQSRVINFSTESNLKALTLSTTDACDFNSILPGTLIKTVLKLSKNGSLEGTFNGFPTTVSSDHHRIDDSSLSVEQIMTVIGLDNSMKQLDCSLLPHLRPPFKGFDELLSVEIGHSEPNCSVQSSSQSRMVLTVPNRKYSTVVVIKTQIEPELLKGKKSAVTVRYTDYNLLDNVVKATTLSRLLALSYFSIRQVKLGEIVKGVISQFSKAGYAVQISSKVIGLIPFVHISDKPINNPQTAYKAGDSVKCRVFHVDVNENKLLLTTKKSLIESNLPIIGGFKDLSPGMTIDGFVARILDYGLVVVLFNNIKGWVPISRIPETHQKSLKVSYYVGKHVEVTVVRWDDQKQKIELSLTNESKEEDIEELSNYQISVGDMHEAIILQIRPDGFNVRLTPMNKHAFLPFDQLSDSRQHRTLFRAHYSLYVKSESQINTTVTVINIQDKKITVSRKNSLIQASIGNRLLKQISQISVDTEWIGWIIKKESYGLFVELPTGVRGLVRNKNICDFKPIKGHVTDLFEIGDTVQIKIIEVDLSKSNRLLFSLQMSHTYRAADHMQVGALDFLISHLQERKLLQSTEHCKKVNKLEIGQLVNVLITARLDWGFTLCIKLENNEENTDSPVTGFVRNALLPDQILTTGSIHRAIIIDIDIGEQAVEVCMVGSMINAVTNRKNACTKIDVGQNIKSIVLSINEDFIVAMLKGHAHGNIVYIPAKRFWNDITKESNWIVNQQNHTIIKTVLPNEVFIGSLLINEPIYSPSTIVSNDEEIQVPFKKAVKKVKVLINNQYPVYFHSFNKSKVFFNITKKQRCFCNLIEFSNSINEIERIIYNPPSQFSSMNKKIHIISKNGKGIPKGHFLDKDDFEVGDSVCCEVISVFKNVKYRLKLPFHKIGFIDPMKLKNKSLPYRPKIGTIIQCKVVNKSPMGNVYHYFMSMSDVKHFENEMTNNETNETEEEEDQEQDNKVQKAKNIDHLRDEENDDERKDEKESCKPSSSESKKVKEISWPTITIKKKDQQDQPATLSLLKRIHQSDDEENTDEENSNEDEVEMDSCGPSSTKKAKIDPKLTNTERELNIRNAEKRRETGDHLRNPTNEAEFELLIFNSPNESSSWIRYMRFILEKNPNHVDKARSIAERAMKTIQLRDQENRFRIMKEYISLEIEQLDYLKEDLTKYDNQLISFRNVFERGLVQKSKLFFVFSLEKLLEKEMFELAEDIAKRFVKEYSFDSSAWFQLFLVRFLQKKYSVAKETIVNAERALKKIDFRDLTIRIGQLEIEKGDVERGTRMLMLLIQSRPKDNSIKNRIVSIFEKNNLQNYISQINSIAVV